MLFDQQQLLEDVKKLLKDVEVFFSTTLKREKLKKEVNTQREDFASRISHVLGKLTEDDEPQDEYNDVAVESPAAPSFLAPPSTQEDFGDIYDDAVSRRSSDDNDEEAYSGAKARPVTVLELKQSAVSIEGMLEKKKKEGQFGLSAFQKRYCVIKDHLLYYYKKQNDKKQCNEIMLSGYEARAAPDFDKKNKKKDCLFELVQPGQRSFQFIASTPEDMHSWLDAINRASVLLPPSEPSIAAHSGEIAEPVEEDFGDEYEDLDDYQKFKINQGGPVRPQTSSGSDAKSDAPVEENADFGDTYEDVSSGHGQMASPVTLKPYLRPPKIEQPTPPKRSIPEPPQDDFGDIYDDAESMSAPKLPPKPAELSRLPTDTSKSVRNSPLPAIPVVPPKTSPARELPPPPDDMCKTSPARLLPPPPEDMLLLQPEDETEPWEDDFTNIYIGKWDCTAEDKDELPFKHGDLIHILSKDYKGWWIGEKKFQVGLVPEDYLMKAYE